MTPSTRAIVARPNIISYICDTCLHQRIRSPLVRALPDSKSITYSAATPSYASWRSFPSRRNVARHQAINQYHPARNSTTLRTYSTNANSHSIISHPAESGITPLRHRRLVSLSGAEAAKFLQGLITNNVDPKSFRPFYSACLDARGRMLWDIFVWPQDSETKEWGCYIEVDASEAESLLRHLKRHKLRSKIAIKLLEDEGKEGTTVWAGWGPGVESLLGHESDANPETEPSILASLPDPRAGNSADSPPFAYRFLLRGDEVPANLSVPVIDPEQYRLRRYLYGVPEGPVEIPRESALPMENNIDLAGGIDFRKGCYVGQELTIRTKHTGVVRKRVLPVQLYRATEPAPGPSDMTEHDNQFPHFDPDWQTAQTPIEVPADIKQLDEDGGLKKVRTRGKLIAQMGNVGLAMCRLENMTPMQVSAEGGSYTPGVEFALQGASPEETPVRVKAFLPYWLVTRERQLWDKSPGASGRTAGTE